MRGGGGCMMIRGYFSSAATGALVKIEGITKYEQFQMRVCESAKPWRFYEKKQNKKSSVETAK